MYAHDRNGMKKVMETQRKELQQLIAPFLFEETWNGTRWSYGFNLPEGTPPSPAALENLERGVHVVMFNLGLDMLLAQLRTGVVHMPYPEDLHHQLEVCLMLAIAFQRWRALSSPVIQGG